MSFSTQLIPKATDTKTVTFHVIVAANIGVIVIQNPGSGIVGITFCGRPERCDGAQTVEITKAVNSD